MQVYLVVVLLAHITRHKALILQQVALHKACLDALLNLIIQLFNAADADFLTILRAPDRQRSTPEARTAQIPVVQVLKPVAEAPCTC